MFKLELSDYFDVNSKICCEPFAPPPPPPPRNGGLKDERKTYYSFSFIIHFKVISVFRLL